MIIMQRAECRRRRQILQNRLDTARSKAKPLTCGGCRLPIIPKHLPECQSPAAMRHQKARQPDRHHHPHRNQSRQSEKPRHRSRKPNPPDKGDHQRQNRNPRLAQDHGNRGNPTNPSARTPPHRARQCKQPQKQKRMIKPPPFMGDLKNTCHRQIQNQCRHHHPQTIPPQP